ncbi:MAG: SDR family oxidoreductase [Bacteroidota bacterium]
MDLGLKNRIALVAGASDGLGYATAAALLGEGCRVVICSRSKERIDAAAARMAAACGVPSDQILPIVCDVTDEDSIMRMLFETTEQWGGLDILVTNAGGPPAGYIDNFSADQWRSALELNLISTINLCRHALPLLKKAAASPDPVARILMVTSVSARQPIPNLYLSNTSRAGVQGFAKSLSLELGPLGITVNTIMPGYTKTARLNDLSKAIQSQTGQSEAEIEAGWAEDNALKRLGEPEEFAAAAAFLVSKPAAYITGIGMVVDGGRVKNLL